MGLLGGSKTKTKIIENYPGAAGTRQSIAGAANPKALERLNRAGEAYGGELVAPMSQAEQTSLGTLQDYLASTMPGDTNISRLSQGEIEKTLSGGYDPIQSEYWKAYQNEMQRQMKQASDSIAAKTSASDRFFGGGRIRETADMNEGALSDMAVVLGQLAENERNNRLNTAMNAPSYLGQNEALTQGRIQAGQQFGALPREIQQAEDTAKYTEWQRQLADLGIPLDVAQQLAQPMGVVQSTKENMNIGPLIAAFVSAMSDRRMKTDVISIENPLDKISKLTGYTYRYVFNGIENRNGGIMAQDLENVLPDAVSDIQGVKFVRYDAVIALVVNAINELRKKINL